MGRLAWGSAAIALLFCGCVEEDREVIVSEEGYAMTAEFVGTAPGEYGSGTSETSASLPTGDAEKRTRKSGSEEWTCNWSDGTECSATCNARMERDVDCVTGSTIFDFVNHGKMTCVYERADARCVWGVFHGYQVFCGPWVLKKTINKPHEDCECGWGEKMVDMGVWLTPIADRKTCE